MDSRPALRKALISNDKSISHRVEVVADIIEVCPLVRSHLKKLGGEMLATVSLYSLLFSVILVELMLKYLLNNAVLKKVHGRILLYGSTRPHEVLHTPSPS